MLLKQTLKVGLLHARLGSGIHSLQIVISGSLEMVTRIQEQLFMQSLVWSFTQKAKKGRKATKSTHLSNLACLFAFKTFRLYHLSLPCVLMNFLPLTTFCLKVCAALPLVDCGF